MRPSGAQSGPRGNPSGASLRSPGSPAGRLALRARCPAVVGLGVLVGALPVHSRVSALASRAAFCSVVLSGDGGARRHFGVSGDGFPRAACSFWVVALPANRRLFCALSANGFLDYSGLWWLKVHTTARDWLKVHTTVWGGRERMPLPGRGRSGLILGLIRPAALLP